MKIPPVKYSWRAATSVFRNHALSRSHQAPTGEEKKPKGKQYKVKAKGTIMKQAREILNEKKNRNEK